jgi:hypothetical protein
VELADRKHDVHPVWKLERPTLDLIRNQAVVDLSVVGRLPEIVVAFAGDHYVSSFMTSAGNPSWTLFDRRSSTVRWLRVREGRLDIAEEDVTSKGAKQT